jgi:hypothetical protein
MRERKREKVTIKKTIETDKIMGKKKQHLAQTEGEQRVSE